MTCLSSNVVDSPEGLADTAVAWTMAGGTVTYERA
jgi:hypothetical protein